LIREDGFKFCKGCSEWKLAEENFYKSKVDRSDGYVTYCKACEKARVMRYQKANRDKKAQYDKNTLARQSPERRAEQNATKRVAVRRRKEVNPELYAAKQAEYCERYKNKNVDVYRERHRNYYSANIEHSRAVQRKSAARPERKAAIMRHAKLRGALINDWVFFENEAGQKLCHRDWLNILGNFGNRCAYCESEVDGDLEIEHATPKCRGGKDEIGNLVPSCKRCNSLKSRTTVEEYAPEKAAMIRVKAMVVPYLR
jgi:5-methylcytosine-specific restriction endonuclease McrA